MFYNFRVLENPVLFRIIETFCLGKFRVKILRFRGGFDDSSYLLLRQIRD